MSMTDDKGISAGIPEPETAKAEAERLIDELRVKMLTKMSRMAAKLPAGYYTELKGPEGVFKLRDFAASLKDLAAIGPKRESDADYEDLGALNSLFDQEED